MSNFDMLVSQAVARACLLEFAAHASGRWGAVFYGPESECRVPAERVVMEDENKVSLTAYSALPGMLAVEFYCDDRLVTAHEISCGPSFPFRVTVDIGVEDPENVR